MSGSIDLGDVANGIGGFVIRGEDREDTAGGSVASVGDLNGDGFDDLIVGAQQADAAGNAKNFAGAAYVVFGKAGGFTAAIDLVQVAQGTGGFVIQGENAFDTAGRAVSSAGDINGDGFDDLVVGAIGADGAGNAKVGAGAAYVVFGGSIAFPATVDLVQVAQGIGGFVIRGEDTFDGAGRSVASAGDVNGDGFDDLIVGAIRADAAGNAKQDAGAAYVVFGKAAGGAAVDLAQVAQGIGGFVIQGPDANTFAGASVASAGDVNGDGFADLMIGSYIGTTHVLFGTGGVFPASIDLATVAQGIGGFVVQAESPFDGAGRSVASAGDVNADGFDDLIIGAERADGAGNTRRDIGSAYVVFGKAAGFGAAVDLSDVALGQGGFVIRGEDRDDYAGSSVASAGDVNGDGFDDLLVGAERADVSGAAYVVFGKAGGFAAAVDLAQVALGEGGFAIRGSGRQDFIGRSVASAGDVDGDGFDDLFIGAPSADGVGKRLAGAAYVVFGGAFIGDTSPTLGTLGADAFAGSGVADRIDSGAGGDTVAGGFGGDSLAGGEGGDLLRGNGGNDLLAGGLGNDTLAGGLGVDTLAGGQDADAFRFLDARQGGDFILDFAVGIDRIEVSAAGFGLTAGEGLGITGRFVANAAGQASGAIGQFVFDTDDFALLWDADGGGAGAAVLIARFDDPVTLTAADLRVIA